MDPLMIESLVNAHLQARAEHQLTRRRRRTTKLAIPSRIFFSHRHMPR